MRGTILAVCFAGVLAAAPFTVEDACFNQYVGGPDNGKPCNSSAVPGHDVIGELAKFDAQKIVINELSPVELDLSIFTNFGDNSAAMNPFLVGAWLNAGDLLFSVAGQFKYGVPIQSRAKGQGSANGRRNTDPNQKLAVDGESLSAGTLYEIGAGFAADKKGLLTAKSVLEIGSGANYRPSDFVWLQQVDSSASPGFQGTLTALSSGTVTVASLPGNPHLRVDISVPMPAGFYQDALTGTMGLQWATATCGNDLIQGSLASTVPEPSTFAMIGLGFLVAGWWGRKNLRARHD